MPHQLKSSFPDFDFHESQNGRVTRPVTHNGPLRQAISAVGFVSLRRFAEEVGISSIKLNQISTGGGYNFYAYGINGHVTPTAQRLSEFTGELPENLYLPHRRYHPSLYDFQSFDTLSQEPGKPQPWGELDSDVDVDTQKEQAMMRFVSEAIIAVYGRDSLPLLSTIAHLYIMKILYNLPRDSETTQLLARHRSELNKIKKACVEHYQYEAGDLGEQPDLHDWVYW